MTRPRRPTPRLPLRRPPILKPHPHLRRHPRRRPRLYNPGVARTGSRFLRALFVLYALEAGAFLTLAPWGRYWSVRVVARSPERTRPFLESPYFRSFLLGLGLLHLWAAASEIEAWRREMREPPSDAPSPAPREPA